MQIVWDDSDDKPPMRPGYIRVQFETMGHRTGTAYVGAEYAGLLNGYTKLWEATMAIETCIQQALRSARQL